MGLLSIASMVGGGLGCGLGLNEDRAEATTPRKVILLSVDTLRADVLTPYDPDQPTTPHLAEFAAEAVVFDDVIAQAPSTAISHKSILYSLYPAIHKTSKDSVPIEDGLVSPLEAMRAAGLATAAFVDGGQLHEKYGFAKGFDTYRSARKGEKSLERLRSDALAWLDENADNDFFLFLHTYQVHAPFAPPEPYRSEYAGWYDGELPVDRRKGDYYVEPGSDEQRVIVDLYRGEVAYVDDFLGELFADLKERNLWEEIVFIFTSDHGESLGETGFVGHNRFDQNQLAIPLILRAPGVEPGRIEYPVESVDIMPTLFDILDLDPPYAFQGRDLAPLLAGRKTSDTRRVRISEQAGIAAVQEGPHKALISPDGSSPDLIYDISKTPELRLDAIGPLRDRPSELRGEYDRRMSSAAGVAKFFRDSGADPVADPEVREQLEALGYLN